MEEDDPGNLGKEAEQNRKCMKSKSIQEGGRVGSILSHCREVLKEKTRRAISVASGELT